MILSKSAQYAMRAMALLASLPAGDSMRAADLSEQAQVPRNYLSKILRRLVQAGLLESEKGHHGGFRLARAGRKIKLVEVLMAVDEQLDFHACAFGWEKCDPQNPCPLHPIFSELSRSISEWAEHGTLSADAPRPPKRKRSRR